jgi:group II intron reverse transcriptase/maturase
VEPGFSERVMEEAVSAAHWEAAIQAVTANGGAPGADGMRTSELRVHLERHRDGIVRKLMEGRYRPAPARRVEIPKASGGTRGLHIPNVVDRFVQQLLLQVLTPRLDPTMSAASFGFRPGRNAHQAVQQAQAYAREGYDWVVDLDIENFFDQVNHDVLMHRLGQHVRDKRVLKLVGAMLRAGHVRPEGEVLASTAGTPQGGPLSPLLANLYLDALDRELSRRGLRFVRYADDCNIYVRSETAARRVLDGVGGWIARHLKLRVHPSKSGVGRSWERKFLGFTLTTALLIAIAGSSLLRYQDRVREQFTGRGGGTTVELRDDWLAYVRGWWSYYRLAEDRASIHALDGWTRRHMRKCIWQRWHSAAGRVRHLRELGASPKLARAGRSSRGAWRMARNGALHKALSLRTLIRYGFLVPTQLG